MRRGLAPLAVVLALVPSAVQAQGLEPIKLTLKPTAAPTPALKYRLLPEARDLQPGNSAQLYYRAFSPEWTFFRRPEFSKKIDAWSEDPRKVPTADLSFVLNANVLKELDLAARREYCDWEMSPRIR